MTDDLTEEITRINERNARVERDKAWETSRTRRAIIAIFIYMLSAVMFVSIRAADPLVNALIPALGFLFSMASFPFFKEWWVKNIYKQ